MVPPCVAAKLLLARRLGVARSTVRKLVAEEVAKRVSRDDEAKALVARAMAILAGVFLFVESRVPTPLDGLRKGFPFRPTVESQTLGQ